MPEKAVMVRVMTTTATLRVSEMEGIVEILCASLSVSRFISLYLSLARKELASDLISTLPWEVVGGGKREDKKKNRDNQGTRWRIRQLVAFFVLERRKKRKGWLPRTHLDRDHAHCLLAAACSPGWMVGDSAGNFRCRGQKELPSIYAERHPTLSTYNNPRLFQFGSTEALGESLVFNVLQIFTKCDNPVTKRLHWLNCATAMVLFFFNLLLLLINALFICYNMLVVNHAAAKLSDTLPKGMKYAFTIMVGLIISVQMSSVCAALVLDSLAVASIRHMASALANLFIAVVVVDSLARLRRVFEAMHPNLFTPRETGEGAAEEGRAPKQKTQSKDGLGPQRKGEDEQEKEDEDEIFEKDGSHIAAAASLAPPQQTSLEAKSGSFVLMKSHDKMLGSIQSKTKVRSNKYQSEAEKRRENSAQELHQRLTWLLCIIPVACTLTFFGLVFSVVTNLSQGGRYSDAVDDASDRYHPLDALVDFWLLIVLATVFQYYSYKRMTPRWPCIQN
eukprot:jgi/Bigna1/88463/estExt_fgenesh1_pg.C_320081